MDIYALELTEKKLGFSCQTKTKPVYRSYCLCAAFLFLWSVQEMHEND